MRCLLWILTALTVSGQTQPMTTGQAAEDVALLRKALERIHPGLYRYTPRTAIDTAFQDLERRAASAPMNSLEFHAAVSQLLAKIRCDHTKAEEPQASQQYRKTNPSYLPFRFRMIEGRMIAVASDPRQAGPIPRGAEIVSINGRPARELVAALLPLISVDGFTDHAKLEKLSWEFDEYYPDLYGFSEQYDVEYIDASGRPGRSAKLHPVTVAQWKALDPAILNLSDPGAVVFRQLDADTAYLSIATFINYRTPVDPKSLLQPVFKSLKASGAKRLIVDLRSNGGGSDDVGIMLARFLARKPFSMLKSTQVRILQFGDLRQHINTWDQSIFKHSEGDAVRNADGLFPLRDDSPVHQPMADAFSGRVTLLTGPGNASGVTMLLAKIRDDNRENVELVGAETGGSAEGPTAGILVFLKLPHSGINVRIPWKRQYMNIRDFQPGKGLTPDLAVPETVADFRAGRDAALEAATQRRRDRP